MIIIDAIPFSVNKAWQGKRFKTQDFLEWGENTFWKLPNIKVDSRMPMIAYYEFGISSSSSDWDNPIKPFQDLLQNKYSFNDNKILLGIGHKKKVAKNEEYIKFYLYEYNPEKIQQILSILAS